jgi:NAD(P) transhydrogenase subunit beta
MDHVNATPAVEHLTATPSWAMLAYLVSGVLFILALRGLSSPETSRSGNRYGMIGMLIAVVTTIVTHSLANAVEIGGAIAIGGAIGYIVAQRIAMTAMPQLVAAFHSLVGLAAVLVGVAAYLNPGAFGILDASGTEIFKASRIELGLGVAIGAITFSGSVVAKMNFTCSGGSSTILSSALKPWVVTMWASSRIKIL